MSPPLLKREGSLRRRALSRNILWGDPGAGAGSNGAVWPPASGQRATAIADHWPLTEARRTRCCWWGLLSGSVAGLRARRVRPRTSPFPALQLVGPPASGASRFRDDGTPTGRGQAPCRGLGPQSFRCGMFGMF